MKSLIPVLLFVLLLSSAFESKAQSKINFQKTTHNFGNIKETEGKVTTAFSFKNSGSSPLILSGVYASCGCTTPEWSKNPILPGKSGTIKVTFDPKNRVGAFTKTIRVTSNASNSTVMLKIQGEVVQREKTMAELFPRKVGYINMKSNHIAFTRVKNNEKKVKEVEFINLGNEPVRIEVKKGKEHLSVKIKPAVVEPNQKGKFIIEYDGAKRNAFGYVSDRIYLTMNDKADYSNSLSISATVAEDFESWSQEQKANAPVVNFDSREFNFNTIKQGEKANHTFALTNSGKSNLIIRKVKASCGCTAVNPEKKIIKPGESTELKVTFNSNGKHGRQNKAITIITNDPVHSTTVLRLVGTVKVPPAPQN